MHSPHTSAEAEDHVAVFVHTVLRNGLMLVDLLSNLLEDLPEDAFPGEEPGEVLLEMLTGTVRPVVDAAGTQTVRRATALLDEMGARTIADLRAATELSRPAGRAA